MKKTSKLLILAVTAMLLATIATAAQTTQTKGIIDQIIDFIKSIINSITGSKTTTTKATTTTLMCNRPYIQVGNSCCIDQNSNGICDKDEVTTTKSTTTIATTTKATTTTRETTTTEETTTTTTIIKCTDAPNSCGTSLDVLICYESSIYEVTQIPICKNPNTPESYCYIKQVGPNVQGQLVGEKQKCPNGCNRNTNPVSCN